MKVLNYIDYGEVIFGIAKMDYYYAVFHVCQGHVSEFRNTQDFFCELKAITENDAILGVMFPEEIENIFDKYMKKRDEQYRKWDDFLYFKIKPKISKSTIKLFKELGYEVEDIRIFLKFSIFPYDVDPSKPTKTEFIANDFYPRVEEYSKIWIYEYDGNEIKLAPRR